MKPLLPLLMGCSILLGLAAAGPADPPPASAPRTVPAAPIGSPAPGAAKAAAPSLAPPYDEKADGAADISAALAKAKRNNTRVFIQWGANWCGWCKLLHKLAHEDAAIKKEFLYEYEVVLVDVGHLDKQMELAAKYGADLKGAGLPYVTILDADGKVIANQETGALEKKPEGDATPGHDPVKVLAFLAKHQAASPKASDVLAAGLARSAAEKKPVFLHFGAPWCGWCHRLEDWMARPEIHAIFAKGFIDIKVDTDRMAGGQQMLEAHAAKTGKPAGGIPWFECLSADGSVIVTSTGPEGNIGFPGSAAEIAWFIGMVKKAAPNLTAQEVAMLEASLQPSKAAGVVAH